jgi:membrane protease YdiL (CAAX protease family)
MLAMVGVLLWIIVTKEHLPLSSIGLHSKKWGASLGWAAITVVVCFALALGTIELVKQFGWKYGDSDAFSKISLGTITLITVRAGVAEDIFMRGFIIERLSTLTGNTYLAAALSLIPFALLHYWQGPAGILISFVLGGVLTGMYIWRRDLKSNIIAHFLVDFIANVVPALV